MFSELRDYREIEPIPPLPARPKIRYRWWLWLAIAATTFTTSDMTNGWINLLWIVWFVEIGRVIRIHRGVHKRYMKELDEYSARADAYYERMRKQILNYVQRDWN